MFKTNYKLILIISLSIIICFNIFPGDKTDIISDDSKWFNSKQIAQKDLKTKIILVEVFKTWIVSTENTASFLNLIHDTFKSDNFMVLGISTEQPDKVEKYIKDNNITYPVAIGSSQMFSYKVDIPALFLVINGEIHSYDPTKKYQFNYLWNMLDNFEIGGKTQPDSWYEARRQKYFEFFKKSYKMSVAVLETKNIADIPKDMDIKYFEKEIIPNIVEENNKKIMLASYKKETSFQKYLLKEELSNDEKNKILEILQVLKYKPIKINETFFKMTVDGMRRLVDKDFKNPLGNPDVKMKKFSNMLKKGQENIYDIIEISVDKL